jgi:hypothetical protein
MVDEARENLGWRPFSGTLETEYEVFAEGSAFLANKKGSRRSMALVAGMVASGYLILAVGFILVNPTKSPQEFASVSGQVKFKIPTVFESAAALPMPSRVNTRIPTIPELPRLPEGRKDSGNTPGRGEDYESRESGRVQMQTSRGEGEILQKRDREGTPHKKEPKGPGEPVAFQKKKLAGGMSGGQARADAQGPGLRGLLAS